MAPQKIKSKWKLIQKNNHVAINLSELKLRNRIEEPKKAYKRNGGKRVKLEYGEINNKNKLDKKN